MAPLTLTSDQLADRYETLKSQVRKRNRREYWCAAFVVAFGFLLGGWELINADTPSDTLSAIGLILLGIGGVVMVQQMHARTAIRPAPDEAPSLDSLGAQLDRQARALGSAWLWYVAPIVPGIVLIFIAGAMEAANGWIIPTLSLITLGVLAGIVWTNHKGARGFAAERDRIRQKTD